MSGPGTQEYWLKLAQDQKAKKDFEEAITQEVRRQVSPLIKKIEELERKVERFEEMK